MISRCITLPERQRYRSRGKQKGVVAVIVALCMAALVGFVGLALDLGKLYIAKSELQNSADACALAAVRELGGANTNQLALAEAAGIAAGTRHDVLFQVEAVALDVDDSVTFSQTLEGVYQPKAGVSPSEALLARYVRCTVERTGIATWFIKVLNLLPGISIGSQAVAASAVASRLPSQITSCALPVAICTSAITPTPPAGTWLQSAISPSSGNLTGQFIWVDYTPSGGGASELGANLAGPGVCNLPVTGAQAGEGGIMSSLAPYWNSRFGIYGGSINQNESIPDHTGYAYTGAVGSWPTKFNAFADFRSRRGAYAPYQGDTTTGLNTNGTIASSAYLQSSGGDRRLATVGVIDCASFTAAPTLVPVQSWACVLMLHPIKNGTSGGGTLLGELGGAITNLLQGEDKMYLEYLGRSDDSDSPCTTSGLPGGPGNGGPLAPALVQ
jgi:hypothetical protein